MKAYLAARFRDRHDLKPIFEDLTAAGVEVTSRWINYHETGDPQNVHVLRGDETPTERDAKRAEWAKIDLADVDRADVVISFTRPERETGDGRGGRHVEFGYALAIGKRLVVVGHRENIFHCLPQIEWYPDWPSALSAVTTSLAEIVG